MPRFSEGREAQHEAPQYARIRDARPGNPAKNYVAGSGQGGIAPKNPLGGAGGPQDPSAIYGSLGGRGNAFTDGSTPTSIGGVSIPGGGGPPSPPGLNDGSNPGGSVLGSWRRPGPGSAQSGPEWEMNVPAITGPNNVSNGQIAPEAAWGLGAFRPDDHKPDVVGRRVAKWGPGGAPKVSNVPEVFDQFGQRGPGASPIGSALTQRLHPGSRVTDGASDPGPTTPSGDGPDKTPQPGKNETEKQKEAAEAKAQDEAEKKADVRIGSVAGAGAGAVYAAAVLTFIPPADVAPQVVMFSNVLSGALVGGAIGWVGHETGLFHLGHMPSDDDSTPRGPGGPRSTASMPVSSVYRPADEGGQGKGPGAPRLRSAQGMVKLTRDLTPNPEDSGSGTPRSRDYRPNPEDSGGGSPRS